MTDWQELSGRRKHDRFRVEEGTLVVLGAPSAKAGHVIDISLGGLSFSYVADGESSIESSALHIFLSDGDFYLEDVAFETVSDFQMPRETPFSVITMRRKGVKFRKLTDKQLTQLKHFIQNHATGLIRY
jgi:hypothetical protein